MKNEMAEIDPFASSTELLALLRARHISSVELLNLYLNRMEQYNPQLNAVVTLDSREARLAAQAADARRVVGDDRPLLGLPLTLKDAIDVKGLPTTAGLRRRRDQRADNDAPLVARLRDAGAVIMGKTNVPSYVGDWQTNNPIFGRSNNPWDLTRTPGGSTGGGAAALAAGLTPLEFGSDIGGSIRIPAAFCGLYGHRPSETAVPRSGHWPGSASPNPAALLNVMGPLARSAADLQLALDVISGPEIGEDVAWRLALAPARHERLADYRIAILPPISWLPVQAEISMAVSTLASNLSDLGATVEETQPDVLQDMHAYHIDYRRMLAVMFSFNAEHDFDRRRRQSEEALERGDEFTRAWARALVMSAHDLMDLLARREIYRASFRQFFDQWDVLLMPAAPVVAFPHRRGEEDGPLVIDSARVPYNHLSVHAGVATLCGQPSTAFPAGRTAIGLPIGLQALGPYLEDRTPLRFTELLAAEFGGFLPPAGYRGDPGATS